MAGEAEKRNNMSRPVWARGLKRKLWKIVIQLICHAP